MRKKRATKSAVCGAVDSTEPSFDAHRRVHGSIIQVADEANLAVAAFLGWYQYKRGDQYMHFSRLILLQCTIQIYRKHVFCTIIRVFVSIK